jgi:ribosomal protein S18 acetylase RimI-like enzyme
MNEFEFSEAIPAVEDYQNLRRAVGWYVSDDTSTMHGLQNSLYSLCVMLDRKLIGYGRIVGDGGIYYYIQDIIVLPEYQKSGIGRQIMNRVMEFLRENAAPNSFVGLMAAAGVQKFYENYGFAVRPADRPGMFQVWK